MFKNFQVSCAIIEKNGLVLATQRSEVMSLPLKWEFPGGKIAPSEDAATCLIREIREELGIGINILTPLSPSFWRYADFAVTLYPFICHMGTDQITLAEHKALLWVRPEDLPRLDWAEADVSVVYTYLAYLDGNVHGQ